MTKKIFLKRLEDKLHSLNKTDKKNIIKKYSDMLDELMKNGKTEKEATSSFSNIDELANTILSDYKSKHSHTKEAARETKQIMDYLESSISKYFKEFSDGLKNILSSCKRKNGTLNFFQILFHFFKLVILFSILAVFYIFLLKIDDFGREIFANLPLLLKNILTFVWHLINIIIYISFCLLMTITFFKKYFDTSYNKKNKSPKKEGKNQYSLSNVLIKIIASLALLVPIWAINIGLVASIIFLIYIQCRGVFLLGILTLLFGLSLLFGFLADIIKSLIYKYRKIHFLPFIVGAIFIIVGSIIFTFHSLDFKYINESSVAVEKKETIYEEIITGKTEIDSQNMNITFDIDESLSDNTVIIKITYYDTVSINLIHENNKINIIKTKEKNNILDLMIDDLKNKEIYNYRDLFTVSVNVYTNKETFELLDRK